MMYRQVRSVSCQLPRKIEKDVLCASDLERAGAGCVQVMARACEGAVGYADDEGGLEAPKTQEGMCSCPFCRLHSLGLWARL